MTVIFYGDLTVDDFTKALILHSNNWASGGTVSASSTASGYFADAPNNTLTYEKWRPSSLPATWEYDHGSDIACNCVAIAAHDLGTTGAAVNFQYHDGAGWTSFASPSTEGYLLLEDGSRLLLEGTGSLLLESDDITDDSVIFIIFPETTASRFRLLIDGTTTPKIGVVKFGNYLEMQRPIYGDHQPITMARQTVLRSNMSESGEYLGRSVQRMYLQTTFDWRHLTAAWVREHWPSLQLAIEAEPFFIAWRPATFGETALCQVDQVPAPVNMGIRDLMQVSMAVRGRNYE